MLNVPPMQPNNMLSVRLAAQEWNAVLEALQEAKYRVAAPLIHKISLALQAAAIDATIPQPDEALHGR